MSQIFNDFRFSIEFSIFFNFFDNLSTIFLTITFWLFFDIDFSSFLRQFFYVNLTIIPRLFFNIEFSIFLNFFDNFSTILLTITSRLVFNIEFSIFLNFFDNFLHKSHDNFLTILQHRIIRLIVKIQSSVDTFAGENSLEFSTAVVISFMLLQVYIVNMLQRCRACFSSVDQYVSKRFVAIIENAIWMINLNIELAFIIIKRVNPTYVSWTITFLHESHDNFLTRNCRFSLISSTTFRYKSHDNSSITFQHGILDFC